VLNLLSGLLSDGDGVGLRYTLQREGTDSKGVRSMIVRIQVRKVPHASRSSRSSILC